MSVPGAEGLGIVPVQRAEGIVPVQRAERVVHRITVLGAGTMGHGIAHAAIVAGYETTMYDVAEPALDSGRRGIAAVVEKGVEIA